jgi:hypothetical protein
MSSFAFKDLKVQQKLLDQDQQQREEERSRRHTLSRETSASTSASSVSEDSDGSSNKSDVEHEHTDSNVTSSLQADMLCTTTTVTTTTTTIIPNKASTSIISGPNTSKQKSGVKCRSNKFSILSSLRRRNVVVNPTESSVFERNQDEKHDHIKDEAVEQANLAQPATFKSAIVKYFQRDPAVIPTLTKDLTDVMEFPGDEESREKVRRQVENNKSSKAPTQRRKSNKFRTTVSMLERSQYVTEVDFPSTRRIDLYKDSSGDLDLYHVDDDFDDDYEMREFGAHFFEFR